MANYSSILSECLQSPFNIERYRNFVVNFLEGTELKSINGLRSADFFAEYSYYVQGYALVGEYTDPKRNKVGVFAVKLKSGRDIEKARSKQRNLIARLIADYNFDAALAAFYLDEESKWRLSFVRLDYEFVKGKVSKSLTPAKRYSYLVGKDEPCHTAQESLLPIFAQENFTPTIDSIEQAFSIEKVTKQFFETYKEKYIEVKEYLETIDCFMDEAHQRGFSTEQFAKKLMGQIVFLYFLQKKGWLGVNAIKKTITEREYKNLFFYNAVTREFAPRLYVQGEDGNYVLNSSELAKLSEKEEEYVAVAIKGEAWGTGPRTFVRDLFNVAQKKGKNFYDDYLEPLFYEGLNHKRNADNYYARLHCRIPFLNGGLFEPLDNYDWENNSFSIPNEMFSNAHIKGTREADGILDIFDRYNFTMNEDEPLEKEVAVDPEMLGKIFENLLDVSDRKSKGAFYTPREIVHYMCQESLANYLVNTVGTPYEDTKDFVVYGEIMKDEDCSRERREGMLDMLIPDSIYSKLSEIDAALADVRVADPAVGSGAFPMGMLSEIVKLREIITEYMARDLAKKPEFANWYRDQKVSARLNAERWKLRNQQRNSYRLKKETMRNSIYAVDIEPSAVDIAKLRLWLTLVVEQEIDVDDPENDSPLTLPNLDCNIMCGNSLIDEFEGIDLSFDSILFGDSYQSTIWSSGIDTDLEQLFAAQREYFYADNHDSKQKYKERIDTLKNNLIALAFDSVDPAIKTRFDIANCQHSTPFFLWKLNFAKVFKDKGGFDIVIGNPPYVGESGHKEIFRNVASTRFGSKFYLGKMDFFYFFFHKGLDLLSNYGELAFITTNYYVTATGAKKLRTDFKSRTYIRSLINFNEVKVFESALGQHNMITLLTKNKRVVPICKSIICNESGFANSQKIKRILDGDDRQLQLINLEQDNIYDGDDNYIRQTGVKSDDGASIGTVLDKMARQKYHLNDFAEVNQGVVSGCDTVAPRNMKYIDAESGKVKDDGIYVFDLTNSRDLEVIDTFVAGNVLLKDFYKNSDIMRYYCSGVATKKLLYYPDALDSNKYPDVLAHLQKFRNLLEARLITYNEHYHWTALHRARREEIFSLPKIVVPYRTRINTFAYNDIEWFCRSDCYVITAKNNDVDLFYLLGVLNSKLTYIWLYNRGKRKGEILELFQVPLCEIPIIDVDEEVRHQISQLAKEITEKKKTDSTTNTIVAERKIDALLYKAYNLAEEEIALVEETVK